MDWFDSNGWPFVLEDRHSVRPRPGDRATEGDKKTVIVRATRTGWYSLKDTPSVYLVKGSRVEAGIVFRARFNTNGAWELDWIDERKVLPPRPSRWRRLLDWLLGRDRIPRARSLD